MTTYASYAPRFKPPKYKNKGRLLKSHLESDFIRTKNVSQLNIVLFGCGSIGSGTLRRILENRELHSALFNQRYNIKAVFDSTGFVYNGTNTGEYESCISDSTLINIIDWKHKNKNSLRTFRDIGYYYTDFERMKPNLLCGNNTIIIDTTNESDKLNDVFLEHLKKGGGIVMGNKKHLSGPQHIFDGFMSPDRLPRIGYETTVGAAVPFINTLQSLIVSGDNIYKLEGIITGSIGWILSEWQLRKGLFADIVMEAHCNGLCEPDPRDDILGIDNARKALILARSLGINCELDTILKNTVNLLPIDRKKLMEMSPLQFTNIIKDINEDELQQYLLETCVNHNNGHNMNLKYVTEINTETEEIKIELRNTNGLFQHVYGTSNILQFTTDCYPPNNPLIIQGLSSGITNSVNSIMTDLYKVGVAIK